LKRKSQKGQLTRMVVLGVISESWIIERTTLLHSTKQITVGTHHNQDC